MQIIQRNILIIFIILLSFFICSSCDSNSQLKTNNDSKSNKVTIESMGNDISNHQYKILNQKTDNIKFNKDFFVNFPDITSISSFDTIAEPKSVPDAYEYFNKCFDLFFGEKYTKKQKEQLLKINNVKFNSVESDKEYPDFLPTCKEYEKEIKNDSIDVDFFDYADKNGALECTKYGMTWVFCGDIMRYDKVSQHSPSFYFATTSHEIKESIKINSGTDMNKTFELSDKPIKISEACIFSKKFIDDKLQPYNDKDFSTEVSGISVINIGNNKNGLCIWVAPAYKNVPFDTAEMKQEGSISASESSDKKNYQYMPGEVFMLRSNKADYIAGLNYPGRIENIKESNEIISLENAFNIMTNTFSKRIKFNLKYAEFVYTSSKEDEESDVTHHEPEWKFVAYNEIDNQTYWIYINALTGKLHYLSKTEE